jgi:hypothetical protein
MISNGDRDPSRGANRQGGPGRRAPRPPQSRANCRLPGRCADPVSLERHRIRTATAAAAGLPDLRPAGHRALPPPARPARRPRPHQQPTTATTRGTAPSLRSCIITPRFVGSVGQPDGVKARVAGPRLRFRVGSAEPSPDAPGIWISTNSARNATAGGSRLGCGPASSSVCSRSTPLPGSTGGSARRSSDL